MFLTTFASCFDLTTHAWFEPTTDQQQSFRIRVGSSRPATNAHLLETQGPRDEILPTKNVASRADFDAASSTEVFAALGSQLEHVDGRSCLPASGRSTPSDLTSAVGAIRATGR